MSDKKYTFYKHTRGHVGGPSEVEKLEVYENDLTRTQKDLLIGELIKKYNDSPTDTQAEFMVWLYLRDEKYY